MENEEHDLDLALSNWHDHRVDRRNFSVYVGGDPRSDDDDEPGVEYRMADRFDLNLSFLTNINATKPILVLMSSCGGDFDEGMQMFSSILTCPNPVTVLALKAARSMTSIIPLAADKFALRTPSKYMFHRGTFSFCGLEQEVDTNDVERRKMDHLMFRIYSSRLKEQGRFKNCSEDDIKLRLRHQILNNIDVWLDPYEAQEWGFVDTVFEGDYNTLRASGVNRARRKNLLSVLRQPINVEVKVS